MKKKIAVLLVTVVASFANPLSASSGGDSDTSSMDGKCKWYNLCWDK